MRLMIVSIMLAVGCSSSNNDLTVARRGERKTDCDKICVSKRCEWQSWSVYHSVDDVHHQGYLKIEQTLVCVDGK